MLRRIFPEEANSLHRLSNFSFNVSRTWENRKFNKNFDKHFQFYFHSSKQKKISSIYHLVKA